MSRRQFLGCAIAAAALFAGSPACLAQQANTSGTTAEAGPGTFAGTELKFREFFKTPVGPRGLEPSAKLLSLDGKVVRIAGYMAQSPDPVAGEFILSPLPVVMGDEDENLVDDLPAAVVYVHLAPEVRQIVPFRPGLVRLAGRLAVGNQNEAGDRVSTVRLYLDAKLSSALVQAVAQR